MIRLVYNTFAFGPINLEYYKRKITVGSHPQNDLVVLHPSVAPSYGQITLREESLVLDVPGAASQEYFVGDQLVIGEVSFGIERSPHTVAVPQWAAERLAATTSAQPAPACEQAVSETPVPAGSAAASGKQYYCANCQGLFGEGEVHRIGLKGRAKHVFCPSCSHPLEPYISPEELRRRSRKGFWGWLRSLFRI